MSEQTNACLIEVGTPLARGTCDVARGEPSNLAEPTDHIPSAAPSRGTERLARTFKRSPCSLAPRPAVAPGSRGVVDSADVPERLHAGAPRRLLHFRV